tara:strand:- start:1980 stop:2240 length:261 start_codon:yes stop_codon:yes gene_type:complete
MAEETGRAKLNKQMLAAVRKYIKVKSDGSVVVTKGVGSFKQGQQLPMVGIKGASLISTDPKSNLSWQKENVKTVKSIFNAIKTNAE